MTNKYGSSIKPTPKLSIIDNLPNKADNEPFSRVGQNKKAGNKMLKNKNLKK